MKFIVRGVNVDLDVTSVILEYDSRLSDVDNLILWHCPICNQPLFQYSGRMVMIVPGMTPTDIPVIVACNRCKKKYLINSISNAKIK